jgi:hypothetical protein
MLIYESNTAVNISKVFTAEYRDLLCMGVTLGR